MILPGDVGDYLWLSYRTHGLGTQALLWTPHAVYLSLGDNAKARQKAHRGLMSELLEQEVMVKIRHCVNTGLVLGSEKFRQQIAEMIELKGAGYIFESNCIRPLLTDSI